MKYCPNCGQAYSDQATTCTSCGYNFYATPAPNEKSGLETTIKVFLIIGAILTSLMGYFIPLAWCIPLTILAFKRLNNHQPMSVGFKVCVLLFVSTIGGILLLCHNENIAMELTEAKRLFDNEIITDEEYQRIRNSIISKYYK